MEEYEPIRIEVLDSSKRRRNLITALTIFISVLALGTAIWSSYQTWENNRLSVLPKIDFQFDTREGRNPVGLSVLNVGVGPAVVRKFRILSGDKEFKNWVDLIEDIGEPTLTNVGQRLREAEWWLPSEGEFLSAGETIPTFVVRDGNGLNDKIQRENLNKFLKLTLQVVIEYCSVYDRCWIACSDPERCPTE